MRRSAVIEGEMGRFKQNTHAEGVTLRYGFGGREALAPLPPFLLPPSLLTPTMPYYYSVQVFALFSESATACKMYSSPNPLSWIGNKIMRSGAKKMATQIQQAVSFLGWSLLPDNKCNPVSARYPRVQFIFRQLSIFWDIVVLQYAATLLGSRAATMSQLKVRYARIGHLSN